MPSSKKLREGIVNKYFDHYKPDNDQNIKTSIFYRSFQVIDDQLIIGIFSDAYTPLKSSIYSVVNDQFVLQKELRFNNKDTHQTLIIDSVYLDWRQPMATSLSFFYSERDTTIYQSYQHGIRDTIVEDRQAKIIDACELYTYTYDKIEHINENQLRTIYVEGLGIYYRSNRQKNGYSWSELIEQIPLQEFYKDTLNILHDMRYIDPDSIIDATKDFKICNEHLILSYFARFSPTSNTDLNKFDKATFKKKAYKLNTDNQLLNESGYLTIRFIINCHGDAGHFILDQSDLNFQPKRFDEDVAFKLYRLVRDIGQWSPTIYKQDTFDIYNHLTFKLQQGKIIEIFP